MMPSRPPSPSSAQPLPDHGRAGAGEEPNDRRIVALVLPELLCELALSALSALSARGAELRHGSAGRSFPLGVLLVDSPTRSGRSGRTDPSDGQGGVVEAGEEAPSRAEEPREACLAAVNAAAERFGVRVGQTVAEAQAFVTRLSIKEVTREQVLARLGEVAEVALGFGPTVSIESPDTVWVDVSGAAHLSGGEDALALELAARVRELGHRVRVSISGGPRLAQALARWGRANREGAVLVPRQETARNVAALPVRALPIDAERTAWLVRLGVFTVGDLVRLPRSATAARLGDDAGFVLDLAEGKDASPLVVYVPPSIPREESIWDEPMDGVEPLLFVLRGLLSRLSARLEGRGEALQAIDLVLLHDRSIARLRNAGAETALRFELAAPMWRREELFRIISSRLGRTELSSPVIGLRIEARAITRALALQLNLSRYAAGLGGSVSRGPETLPVLVAELLSDLGKDKVGVLRLEGSHRPEKKSRLVPVTPSTLAMGQLKERRSKREPVAVTPAPALTPEAGSQRKPPPTRLLPRPIPFDGPLRRGVTVSLEHRLYSIERVAFEERLDSVEWWSGSPVSRDYVRVWLQGVSGSAELIVFVDKTTGERKIQAICD
jgi:protein ImuB